MKSIFELAPKPSDAVQAMIDGLRNQYKRLDFKIVMAAFAGNSDNVCYGCAATCALQEISNKDLVSGDINLHHRQVRAKKYNLDVHEVESFEMAIDLLRTGEPYYLLYLYGVRMPQSLRAIPNRKLPFLTSENWVLKIKDYEKFAGNLKKMNL